MMASIALAIGAYTSGGMVLLQLQLDQLALLARGGGRQRRGGRPGRAARSGTPTSPPSLWPITITFRICRCCAEIIHQRDGIVDEILEAEILRLAEFRLPAAGAALVVTQRGDVARHQLLAEFFQCARFDLRAVAVVVGGAGARDSSSPDSWRPRSRAR